MKKEQPTYYAVLSAEVRYDKELKPNEKLMYAEFTALSSINGYCHATNKYFAELYDVDKSTISRYVSHLEEKGYIKVELIRNEKQQVKERRIYIVAEKSIPYMQNNQDPIDLNIKENNTSKNNTSKNNINSNSEKKEDIKPKKNFKSPLFDRITEYTQNQELRDILKKWLTYKLSSSRGFTLDQFNMQLENLARYGGGDVQKAIEKVKSVYSKGYQSLVYENEIQQAKRKSALSSCDQFTQEQLSEEIPF